MNKAIALDPGFALAVAVAAQLYVWRKIARLDVDPAKDRLDAERLARRALQLDPEDPRVLWLAGNALMYVVGLIEEGAGYIEQAHELDANLAGAWCSGGYARLMLGQDSIGHFERALRLNPLDPAAFDTLSGLAHAHCYAGNYDEAAVWAEKALLQSPSYVVPHWALIVSNALAGRIEKAQQAWKAYQLVEPTASISNILARSVKSGRPRPEILDKYEQALRLVGVPD